jgi:hypothetical protein
MRAPGVPEFRLRFPLAEVRHWADGYAYADDSGVENIGEVARQRGWYTRDEFVAVTLWKTERSKSRCAKNTAATIREITEVALHAAD